MDVYRTTGDVDRFASWTVSQAIKWGFSEERVAVLKQVTAEIQQAYAKAGRSGVSRFLVDQITNQQLGFDPVLKSPIARATLYGAAGRLDEAFECLDQAIECRVPGLVYLEVAPDWDSLRGDARFDQRLARMGLTCGRVIPEEADA